MGWNLGERTKIKCPEIHSQTQRLAPDFVPLLTVNIKAQHSDDCGIFGNCFKMKTK